jgi:putative DNA primase/helicase
MYNLDSKVELSTNGYLEMGLSVIPLKYKDKSPLGSWKKYQSEKASIEQVTEWSNQYPICNWGIVTGEISGIVVVDIDNLELYEQSGIVFPVTPTVRTGKGLHLYFNHPGFSISNNAKSIFEWCDIRGDGGFVVAPPSVHPNGHHYEWVEGKSPQELEFAEVPQWLQDQLKNHKKLDNVSFKNNTKNSDVLDLIKNGVTKGSRNASTAIVVGHYFACGLQYEDVKEIVTNWNASKNKPPLSNFEVLNVVNSIYSIDTRKKTKQYVMDEPYIRSYLNENGEEVCERGSFKHTVLAETIMNELPLYRNGRYFYFYDEKNGLWKLGAEDKIKYLIAEKLGVHATNNRVSETFNQVVRKTPVDQGEQPFERNNPFLLNLQNGVLDLSTGEFSPTFNPQFYHRIKLPISYNPNASSEEVDKFLSSVLNNEDIPFINEVAASILAKKMINPALVFLLGSGGNGKSQLLKLLTMLAGRENTASIPMETLQNDRFATAELYMKLFNNCGDIGDGWLPQSDILKQTTGGDTIYAQFKGKDPFTFLPFAVQVYSANNEPKFKDLSQGMKDRIYPVPMERTFRGSSSEVVNPLAKIDDYQLSGWLNHLIKVFQELMKRQGRYTVSDGMKRKRDEWFNNMDVVGQFLEEECITSGEENLIVAKKDLWQAFSKFLTDNGYSIKFTKQSFEKRLTHIGIVSIRKRLGDSTTNPIHCFQGISLVDNLKVNPF